MLAPKKMNKNLLAPCGMNCLLCYKHLGKGHCSGCFAEGSNKPKSCRTCKIRDCAIDKGIQSCAQCAAFPCKWMKTLDKSYRTRYGVSLISFGKAAAQDDKEIFLQKQVAQYTCPECGGLISLHDGDCSECKTQYQLGRNKGEDT